MQQQLQISKLGHITSTPSQKPAPTPITAVSLNVEEETVVKSDSNEQDLFKETTNTAKQTEKTEAPAKTRTLLNKKAKETANNSFSTDEEDEEEELDDSEYEQSDGIHEPAPSAPVRATSQKKVVFKAASGPKQAWVILFSNAY